MKILIDAMGGDKAPLEIIKGALLVKNERHDLSLCLVGNEQVISDISAKEGLDLSGMEIVNAEEVIAMCDPPLSVRTKTKSSLRVALELLREGKGDALVSAGSTGAIHTGATLFIGRQEGVRRSSIGSLLPFNPPLLLIDSGANTQVTPDHLLQFAVMGSVYMKKLCHVNNPRVGLLNIGSEEIKGTKLQTETYKKLKEADGINFIGNVEGVEAPMGVCDVLVSDGFSGNIFLKTTEGAAKLLLGRMKSIFTKNLRTKIAYLLLKDEMKSFKKDYDVKEQGGAPILGIKKTVIKAHGSSDARAIRNAIIQASEFAGNDISEEIGTECNKYTCLYDEGENNDRKESK